MTALAEVVSSAARATEVDVGGRRVRLTNLDKVLWPRTGTTKRELFAYYIAIASALLPHIAGRPLTLGRYPDGVEGVNWFQTTCPHPPPWMETYPVRARDGGRGPNYCLVMDLAGLLWVVNLASIELHPLLVRSHRRDEATVVVFDLDAGPGASLAACCRVACELRARLSSHGLEAYPKTSGLEGLHVYVPLNSGAAFADTRRFARAVAADLARDRRDVTHLKAPRDRVGKVLIDWGRNSPNLSTVAPYSLRAMGWPVASTPVTWEEVEAAGRGLQDSLPRAAVDTIRRVETNGDLFAGVLAQRQALPSLR
jgi:bifunctional non-homologous end joining protein LigD